VIDAWHAPAVRRAAVPLALVACLLAWRAAAPAPDRADRPVARLPDPAPPPARMDAAPEPAAAPPLPPVLRSYDLRALAGAEARVRQLFGESIVGGSGGSLDVCGPTETHAAIEALLAATATADLVFLDDRATDRWSLRFLNDGFDGDFGARMGTASRSALFFNDGSDGEIRTRVENVFDRPLTP